VEVTGQACLGVQEAQEVQVAQDDQGRQAFLEVQAVQLLQVFRLLLGALAFQVDQVPQGDQNQDEEA